jgi:HEAT repeat protein
MSFLLGLLTSCWLELQPPAPSAPPATTPAASVPAASQSAQDASPTAAIEVARLKELLYQRDRTQEQGQAAMLLVQSSAPEAQTIVRDGLRRHDRTDVFQALASAIRLWREARYIPLLLQALTSDQLAIRQSAMEALAAQAPKVVTPFLLSLAEDSSASFQARQAAIGVLGRSFHKAAVAALLKLLGSDTLAIRQAAAAALQEISGQVHGPDALAWQTWWQPYKDLSDEAWLVTRTALLSDRSRRLSEELSRTENALLQAHQQLLSKIPPTDRASYFRSLAQVDFPALRTQAVIWIGDALKESSAPGLKAHIDLLLQLSRDGNEAVQRQAVLTLENVDDPRAFDRLLELLQAGTSSIRTAAARSLGRFGASKTSISAEQRKRAAAALEQALNDSSLSVVASAAESIGAIQAPQAGPLLMNLLKHHDDGVRQAAALALENIATLEILSAIYLGLEDASPQVRFALVGAIGRIGGKEKLGDVQLGDLLKRLAQVLTHDTDPGVRSRAATVIGDVGSPAELPLLWLRVRAQEDNRVQLRAWSAMLEILARAQSAPLLAQWEQTLTELNENPRRTLMFTELRDRWSKQDVPKPLLEATAGGLVRALLAERKWQQAAPLAVELTRKAGNEADRRERLRWILVACTHGLNDRQPQEVLRIIKEVEEWLPEAKELGAEFADVRRRAQQMQPPGSEPGLDQPGPKK